MGQQKRHRKAATVGAVVGVLAAVTLAAVAAALVMVKTRLNSQQRLQREVRGKIFHHPATAEGCHACPAMRSRVEVGVMQAKPML